MKLTTLVVLIYLLCILFNAKLSITQELDITELRAQSVVSASLTGQILLPSDKHAGQAGVSQ